MSDSVYFKEDPRQIADIASLLQKERNSFSSNLSGMKNKANSIKAFWKSGSADEYQRRVTALDAIGQELIRLLDESVRNLQQASGIYEAAENTAAQASEGLPTDGVFR